MTDNDVARYVLAGVVVIGFCVVGVAWMVAGDKSANKDILMLIVGSFCTGYGTVLGYFFSRRE